MENNNPQVDDRGSFITREEASQIALAAAKEASRQTMEQLFGVLGVNVGSFESLQNFRNDLEWVKRGRKLSELTGNRIWNTIVGLGAGSLAIVVWEAIKFWVSSGNIKH